MSIVNPEEIAGALSYLGTCWGGPVPDADGRALARLFVPQPVEDVMQAIDDFRDRNARRPSPAELAARLRAIRADRLREIPVPPVDSAKLGELYGQSAESWPPSNTTPAHSSAAFAAARKLVP